jgi:cytosine deaminase
VDLILRGARLRHRAEPVDIGIAGDRIERIEPQLQERGTREIDATGCLTTPSFVEPHIHLDKALTADRARASRTNTFEESIAIMREVKRGYTVEDVAARATEVVHWLVGHGVTFVRSYVDVDTIAGLVALEGVLAARERCRRLAHIELIAFPQEGILCDPGTDALMTQAMERGADVVGGMPFAELIDEDARHHTDFVFDLARRFDRDIQMHVDETDDPGATTLHYYAVKALREGWTGRIAADHVTALAAYDDTYAARVIGLVAQARMSVVTLPGKLMRGGIRDKEPRRRGITRVKELLAAGRLHPGVRHRRPATSRLPARLRRPVLDARRHRDALRHGHRQRRAPDAPAGLRPRGGMSGGSGRRRRAVGAGGVPDAATAPLRRPRRPRRRRARARRRRVVDRRPAPERAPRPAP